MKTLFAILTLSISFSALATDFNKVMLEDVRKDVKQNEDSYQKTSRTRGPASVQESESSRLEDQMNQEKKMEKMNFRQNLPSKW